MVETTLASTLIGTSYEYDYEMEFEQIYCQIDGLETLESGLLEFCGIKLHFQEEREFQNLKSL